MYGKSYVSYFALARPYSHLGISALMSFFFTFIIGGVYPLYGVLLATMFLVLAGAQDSINALTDIVADRESWPTRPMAASLIGARGAKVFTATLFLLGSAILSTLMILHFSTLLLGVMAVDIFLRITYSVKPFRLKRFPLLGNLIAAYFIVINPYFAAYSLSSIPAIKEVTWMTLLIFYLLSMTTFVVEDVVTIEGDKMIGDKTIPISIGQRLTTVLTSSLYGLVLLILLATWIFASSRLLWLLDSFIAVGLVIVSSTPLMRTVNSTTVLRACQVLSLVVGLIIIVDQIPLALYPWVVHLILM
jgi:4-hydroxybenzoate polyprenyltransferase